MLGKMGPKGAPSPRDFWGRGGPRKEARLGTPPPRGGLLGRFSDPPPAVAGGKRGKRKRWAIPVFQGHVFGRGPRPPKRGGPGELLKKGAGRPKAGPDRKWCPRETFPPRLAGRRKGPKFWARAREGEGERGGGAPRGKGSRPLRNPGRRLAFRDTRGRTTRGFPWRGATIATPKGERGPRFLGPDPRPPEAGPPPPPFTHGGARRGRGCSLHCIDFPAAARSGGQTAMGVFPTVKGEGGACPLGVHPSTPFPPPLTKGPGWCFAAQKTLGRTGETLGPGVISTPGPPFWGSPTRTEGEFRRGDPVFFKTRSREARGKFRRGPPGLPLKDAPPGGPISPMATKARPFCL